MQGREGRGAEGKVGERTGGKEKGEVRRGRERKRKKKGKGKRKVKGKRKREFSWSLQR